MKQLILTIAAFCLCACVSDVDWDYSGWSETVNETAQTVSFKTSFVDNSHFIEEETIKPGETLKQYNISHKTGNSVGESEAAIIVLEDGTEIICSKDSGDSWSRRFYDNYETRKGAEWYRLNRHELTIETYHIDNELIDLWRKNH